MNLIANSSKIIFNFNKSKEIIKANPLIINLHLQKLINFLDDNLKFNGHDEFLRIFDIELSKDSNINIFYLTCFVNDFFNQTYIFSYLLKSTKKQFFFNIVGSSFKYFRFTSAGRLLKLNGVTTKSAKSSYKPNEPLKQFLIKLNSHLKPTAISFLIKPFTKKMLKLVSICNLLSFSNAILVGCSQYYITKKIKKHRIKKRLRKKLLRLE